ncbi:glycosyl hydrolase [Dyadobacter fermentans]|uniref:Glycoside hydrolase family 2 sugar binding n=1 Tax=Dyadobacter fermentans (strain ATCC 700827 / DSM 18053 / CIP 107007 / KCTC 52180 / NS114) TaxID=471854 RepID=C6VZN3_DYAFD|nr:glycosyl hydrolase [Dyadobacter fermentans]ACT93511.1 glycoside hydrolase family 2 sugar binding [Dyadobacter fermentans DSM 18053]
MNKFYLAVCLAFSLTCSAQIVPQSPPLNVPISSLRTSFRTGPDSLPLAVYWYWLSDHISKEGVVKDLESMKKVGINRAFIGHINVGAPYGEHKLFSDAWWEILHTALKKAGELNIEIGLFNSPGWSQSGGPWIKPEASMRYLASTEVPVSGPKKMQGPLPELGPDAQDVKVLAYPVQTKPEAYSQILAKKDKAEASVEMPVSGNQPMRSLTIQVDKPIKTSAVLYYKQGNEYRELLRIEVDRSNTALNVGFAPLAPVVISLPEVKASAFRLVVAPAGTARIAVSLSSEPQVERYPEKTLAKMFQTPLPLWADYLWRQQPQVTDPGTIVQAKAVRDLTSFYKNGQLTWDVPAGEWKIVRLAMQTTSVTNSPATPEGTGLEVDKMSKRHVATHFDAYLGEILRRIPPQDRRTFKVVVQDSYETGGQNWTDDMEARFVKTYGYNPVPFLPALSGKVVESQDKSDRFLWDLRRLIADRVAYDYVGGLREQSHKHGLTTWLENYGHWGFPGEFLQYGGQSDEVGGEFWSEGSLGDIENKAASSAAHIYGKQKVWAESFTAGGKAFARYPYVMKARGDRFFTEGINSTLLHVFIHQPYEDRWPGMNTEFGNEFNRKNTWFDQMDVFAGYLKRTNLLLQQGRFVADVAYFIGEDTPKMTGICDPALPKGYSFDYINAEVLLQEASVKDGKLTLASGMQYKVLVLPRLTTMRPEVLRKISALVNQGLAILGPAPQSSPSLANYPQADQEVKRMAQALWKATTPTGFGKVGKGYVFGDQNTLENILATLSVIPDLHIAADSASVLFCHRALPDGNIYFLSNQQPQKVKFQATFRQNQGRPQLWDPLTGEVRSLPEHSRTAQSTTLPLELEAYGSTFIVFSRTNEVESKSKKQPENFPAGKRLLALERPWQVHFKGINAPAQAITFEHLIDWKDSKDSTIKYFSGTASYSTTFSMDSLPQQAQYIDLGHVMVMAKVYVNDKYAGGVWTKPYRLNITDFLQKGENTLRVEVVNNWMNRLIGDQHLPESHRKTWTRENPWKASSLLQPSGLLGPVTISSFDYHVIKSE